MSTHIHRDSAGDVVNRITRIDRVIEEWMRSLPMRRPFGLGWDWPGEDLIRVDEYRDGDTHVIRAELPAIDPAKDVELTVADGTLRINAERRVEDSIDHRGYTRHELRSGSLTRTLTLPDGVAESDITATYKDGILEIRVPVPDRPTRTEPIKIPVTTG